MLFSASDPSFLFSCAACLKFQSMPEGTWYCSSCSDGSVSSKKATATGPSGNSKSILIRLSRVVKAPESEIGGCVFCRFVACGLLPFFFVRQNKVSFSIIYMQWCLLLTEFHSRLIF